MAYCNKCGVELSDRAKFCSNCGTEINHFAEKQSTDILSDPSIPVPTISGKKTKVSNFKQSRDEKYETSLGKNTAQKEAYPLDIPNPQYKYMLICTGISMTGFFMAFVPFLFDIDPMEGGGAMLMIGLTFGLSFFFIQFVYRKRARILQDMIEGKSLLVHWTYDDAHWLSHTEETFQETKASQAATFNLIFVITLVICVILIIITGAEEAMLWVCAFMMGFMAILKIISLIVPLLQRRSNLKHKGEVLISDDGLWLSGDLHVWVGFRTYLKSVEYLEDEKVIAFTYRVPNRSTIIQYHTVKVPVPEGEEKEAQKLEAYFYERKQQRR